VVLILLAGICPSAPAAERSEVDQPPETATQPVTQPAEPALPARFEDTPEYSALRAACDLAKARLDTITEDRTKTLAATPEYQAARKAADEAEANLARIRISGSTEERMAASAAFVKAKAALDGIRSNTVNQDPDYRATQAALRKAEAALKDARSVFDRQRLTQERALAAAKAKAAALAAAKDPVRRGQIEGRVAVGMTLAQVQNLYGDGNITSNTPKSRQLDYVVREPNQFYHVLVTFEEDKVVAWTSRTGMYPTLRFSGDIPALTRGMTLDQLQATLGSQGRAIREARTLGSAAMLVAPPVADKANPDNPRPRPAPPPPNPTETYLQTVYCWKVILQTRNGVQHQVLSVKLADFQVYDYRLGVSAD
jgi:hypothetical protein